MQEAAEVFWREKMHVHPDECDDGKNGKHANDDARIAFGFVGVSERALDEGELRAGVLEFGGWFSGLMLDSFPR